MNIVVNLAERRLAREKIRIAFATYIQEVRYLHFEDNDGTPLSETLKEAANEFAFYTEEMLASEYWWGVALIVAKERGVNIVDQTFAKSLDVPAHHKKALAWADDLLNNLPGLCGGRHQ